MARSRARLNVVAENKEPLDGSSLEHGRIMDAATAREFITAGHAHFTLKSKKTQTRFTYRVNASEDGKVLFVSVLTGPDNETAYKYLDFLRAATDEYVRGGAKAKVHPGAPAAVAWEWSWVRLAGGEFPDGLEVWHEGRCGRCGRKLTVPESISTGFGPECAARMRGA